MAMETVPHDAHETVGHHVTPPSTYFKVYLILLARMFATVIAAKIPLGPFNNALAMVIAITKATLVILFFMQVKYGTRLTWLWAGLGFAWFLLLFITLQDYISRDWIHVAGW